MSGAQPFVAPLAIAGGQQNDPLHQWNQLMTIHGHMLDNKKKMDEQRALMELGQIIATTPADQQADAIAQSRAAIYAPEAVSNFINSKRGIVDIAKSRLEQTNIGIVGLGHDFAMMMSDPEITPERAQAHIMARAATYSDPVARRNYLRYANEIHNSIFEGWPTREEQLANPNALAVAQERARMRIDGKVAGALGSWEAVSEVQRGGRTVYEGNQFFRIPNRRDQAPVLQQPNPLVPPNAAPAPQAPVIIEPLSGTAVPAESTVGGGQNALAPPAAPDAATAPPGGEPANALAPPAPLEAPAAPAGAAPGPVSIEPLAGQAAPAAATAAPAAPAEAPAPAEVGSGQSMPPPAATGAGARPGMGAPEPPPGVSPYLNPRTGKPVWGWGGDTYSKVAPWGTKSPKYPDGNGPTEIALADGRLLSSKPYEQQNTFKTDAKTAAGKPIWGEADLELIKEHDKEYMKEGVADENNHRLLGQIATMRDNFATLHAIGGWVEPGAYMDLKHQIYGALKDVGNALGIDIKTLNEGELPTAEMVYAGIKKIAIGMGYSATSTAFPGQREAMQTIQTSLGMVPNGAMSFRGAMYVMRGMEAMAQRDIDKYQFKTNYRIANGHVIGANQAFNKEHSIKDQAEEVAREFGVGPDGFGEGRYGAERLRNALARGLINQNEYDAHTAPRPARR